MKNVFIVHVDADALERMLAFVTQEDFEIQIDDDPKLRESVDLISCQLSAFAEANPAFDDRPE